MDSIHFRLETKKQHTDIAKLKTIQISINIPTTLVSILMMLLVLILLTDTGMLRCQIILISTNIHTTLVSTHMMLLVLILPMAIGIPSSPTTLVSKMDSSINIINIHIQYTQTLKVMAIPRETTKRMHTPMATNNITIKEVIQQNHVMVNLGNTCHSLSMVSGKCLTKS